MQGSGTDNDPKESSHVKYVYLRAHLAELSLNDKVPAHLCRASNICRIRQTLEVQPPEGLFGAEKPMGVSAVWLTYFCMELVILTVRPNIKIYFTHSCTK
jgi:hypothetical protein